MITVNGKQYRNLEEQVRQNQNDILYLLNEGGVLNEFGIKVVGQEPTADMLPNPLTYEGEYGDAYAIGTQPPYTFYIYTREIAGQVGNFWFNVGQFPMPSTVPGPQGPQGSQGPQGPKGALWYSGANPPAAGSQYNTNDMYLDTSSGSVYTLNSAGNWVQTGNIKGPQGIQGPQGNAGLQGAQGPQGQQGPKGDPGLPFSIVGILSSSAQLPTPTKAIQNQAYLIGSTQPYDLFVIEGNDEDGYLWVNLGQVEGATGPQGPQGDPGTPGEPGPQGDPGHPVYYASVPLKENPTIDILKITPRPPTIAQNDLCVGSDGFIARCTGVNGRSITMTTLYSLKGEPGASPTGITVSETAEEGILTDEQLTTLQANVFNYIQKGDDIYNLQIKNDTVLLYSNLAGGEMYQALAKRIAVDIASKEWYILTDVPVTRLYRHRISVNQSGSGFQPSYIEFYIYSHKPYFGNPYNGGIITSFQNLLDNMGDMAYNAVGASRVNGLWYMGCRAKKSGTSVQILYYQTFPNGTSEARVSIHSIQSTTGSVSETVEEIS